ncbi:hypothetical protein CAPSP0001_2553 [Capnocytophaga sputigena ATCC 33612]|nr:hypothetical protein CAPSP0001_2553 [Capnocytophaga sputigena ATCC 33612]
MYYLLPLISYLFKKYLFTKKLLFIKTYCIFAPNIQSSLFDE